MRDSLTIVIPCMPPREVNPNGRWTWRQRASATRHFRDFAGWSAKAQLDASCRWVRASPAITLDAEIAWCCGRKALDDDNAVSSLKAAVDGIADILWDGQDRHVTIGTVTQRRGAGTVTITVWGCES